MKHGYCDNIEQLTKDNTDFRRVLYTAPHSQLVLMSLKPKEEIGAEVHNVDQFFRFESGHGKAVIDDIEQTVKDGYAVIVPAGSRHNVINTSNTERLQFYTLYSPANHVDGVVHHTKADADADEQHDHFDGHLTE